jgi:hypothetical protein
VIYLVRIWLKEYLKILRRIKMRHILARQGKVSLVVDTEYLIRCGKDE